MFRQTIRLLQNQNLPMSRLSLLTTILNQDVAEIILKLTEILEKPKRDMDNIIKQIQYSQGWIGLNNNYPYIRRQNLKDGLKGRDFNKLFKLKTVDYLTIPYESSPYWSGIELLSRQLYRGLNITWTDTRYVPRKKKSEWIECATQNGINVKRSWTVKRIKFELMKI